MTDLRTAAEQALQALERGETQLRYAAITALKAALAEPVQGQAEPVQEPVAWQWQRSETGRASVVGPWFGPLYLSSSQRPAEPEERNFCPRCGKRALGIHTCTPPRGKQVKDEESR